MLKALMLKRSLDAKRAEFDALMLKILISRRERRNWNRQFPRLNPETLSRKMR